MPVAITVPAQPGRFFRGGRLVWRKYASESANPSTCDLMRGGTLEVVAALGERVFVTEASLMGGQERGVPDVFLPAGYYWLRLTNPAVNSGTGSEYIDTDPDNCMVSSTGATDQVNPGFFYAWEDHGGPPDFNDYLLEVTTERTPAQPSVKHLTLGCPTYRVVAAAKCGVPSVCDLDNISDLTFNRVLDDTSEATLVIDLPAEGEDSCCECVGDLRTLIHSILIFRDSELVWGPGPITNLLYRRDQIVITARDVSSVFDTRLIHDDTNLDFTDEDPLNIARDLLLDALAPDDPCDLASKIILYPAASPTLIDRTYTSDDPAQYTGGALRELGRTVLDYTVVGDRILLGSPLSFGPYSTLTDEDFLVDLEIEERGIEAATRWVVQGDAASGSAGGLDPYYGLVEQLADETGIDDDDQATLAAQNRLAASNPAPLYLNVPNGARLSPEAAITFDQLVPGTLFNVNVQKLCRQLFTRMRLTAVSVHVGSSGDEEVGVTLSPMGTGFVQAAG